MVSIPYPLPGGGGSVAWIANDFFNSIPVGTSDGGWPRILDRMITDDRTPYLDVQTIALLQDANYVDIVDDAANLEADLVALGHVVQPFTGIDSTTLLAVLNDPAVGVLVIPDVEVDSNGTPGPDFVDDLNQAAASLLYSFAEEGGIIISHGDDAELYLEEILRRDSLFEAIDLIPAPGNSSLGLPQLGTTFETPQIDLGENTNTEALEGAEALTGAALVFTTDFTGATVASFRVGAGWIYWFGWDWEDPDADSGWIDTLGRAATAGGSVPAPEPAGAGVWLAILAGLMLRRRLERV